jgi:hypothetical protein
MILLAISLASPPPVALHTVTQMNRKPGHLNSHMGEEKYSVLESEYSSMQVIPRSFLKTDDKAIYPRIKKMKNGKYIMFCQGGKIASRIYYYISDDLKEWSEGKLLFAPHKVVTSEGSDTRRFSTADAVVLANGHILVASSYRASDGYKNNIDCGIILLRSADNGLSWSGQEVIYEGANWEPFLLQLPDGRIQCYFTDCHPRDKNSGTSLITSFDNGHTWGSHQRICRQYKYDNNGVRIYTDQMPCFRLLNDGVTLFGFLEARLEPSGAQGESKFMMSVVRNAGFDWPPLSHTGTGPEDRDTNVVEGCAGYVACFPSGETLISCNINREFSLKIGDHTARNFNGASWQHHWFRPFSGLGFWGSLELIDSHRVVGAMHCDDGIQVGIFHLNHRIDAPKATVKIDGEGNEWETDQALFIGSDSHVQTIFRANHDNKYLYLLAERSDPQLSANSTIQIYLRATPGQVILTEVSASGMVSCSAIDSGGNTKAVSGARAVCRKAQNDEGNSGYVAEIAIPLQSLSNIRSGSLIDFNAIVKGHNISDTFTFATVNQPSTWMKIKLK